MRVLRWLPVLIGSLVLLMTAAGAAARPSPKFTPFDVATDPVGNVYVVDGYPRYRILKFDGKGRLLRKWGSSGSAKGKFSDPRGIATDSEGNVYVADRGNSRIQKFTSNGAFITEWGSKGTGNGQFDTFVAGDVAGGAGAIAIDPADNVYVVDWGSQRIQKFTSDGRFLRKWRPAESFGASIAADGAGSLYVGGGVGPIQVFTAEGRLIRSWGGSGSGNGRFSAIGAIAVGPAGDIYVADSWTFSGLCNCRIQKFTPRGRFLRKWGSEGSAKGRFDVPGGVATDPAGNVYVADVGRIQKFTPSGKFILQWGKGSGRTPKRLTIPATRRQAIFRAVCKSSNRCRAKVTIAAGKKTLARGRYAVPPRRSRKVRIALTKAGRRTMARRRHAVAKLTIVDTRTHKRETLPVVLKRR